MVGGRAVGVQLRARCSCDGQAQRRTALAVAMRVGDRGSGRSGAIGDARDMTISDQPSVTVTYQLLTQLACPVGSSECLPCRVGARRGPVTDEHATPRLRYILLLNIK